MAKVHKTYPSPYNGISEQVDELMIDSQCKDMVNCVPDLIQGLSKRPPAIFIALTEAGLLPNAPLGHYPLYVDALDYQGTNDGIEYSMDNNGTPASVLVYDGTRAYFDGNSFVQTQLPYNSAIQSASATFTLTGYTGRWMSVCHWSSNSSVNNNLLVISIHFVGTTPHIGITIDGLAITYPTPIEYQKTYTVIVDSLGRLYLDGVLVVTHSRTFDLSTSTRFVIGCDYDSSTPRYNDGFIGYISDVYLFEGGVTP